MSRQRGQSHLAGRTRPYPHARNRRAPWDTQTSAVVASPAGLAGAGALALGTLGIAGCSNEGGHRFRPARAPPTRRTRSAFCSSRSIPRSTPRTRASSPPSTIPASPMSRTSRTPSNDQNACQTIAQTFANDGCDLILAIATPAAQAAVAATDDIPIIGTAITDFAASGSSIRTTPRAATLPAPPI